MLSGDVKVSAPFCNCTVLPDAIVVVALGLTLKVTPAALLILSVLKVVTALPPMVCAALPLKDMLPLPAVRAEDPALFVQLPVSDILEEPQASVPLVSVRPP